MPLRICAVSFADVRGIRHTVEVQAESLFEAAILGVRTFRGDPWIEHVGPATVLDIEVREPAAKHAITMMQVERWLEGASTSPNEGVKKAKLKDLLGSRWTNFSREPDCGRGEDLPKLRLIRTVACVTCPVANTLSTPDR